MKAGHKCVVFDINADARKALARDGATDAASLEKLVEALSGEKRAVWVMLPAGAITEKTVEKLGTLLDKDDIVIDGGNSFYKDDIRHGQALKAKGLHYVDVGTSGGVWGLARGYCMMIGGDKAVVDRLDPIFRTLAPGAGEIPRTKRPAGADPRAELGYIHAGPVGSGHFVKMVHNGIEYGLMQAYAEGFDILRNKSSEALPEDQRYDLDLMDVAEVWRRGSVIASWLLDLTATALTEDSVLSKFSGRVSDSGEGRWTIKAAIDEGVPVPVLSTALYERFFSRGEADYQNKLLSAMRFQFGGHLEKPTIK